MKIHLNAAMDIRLMSQHSQEDIGCKESSSYPAMDDTKQS